MNVTDWNVKCDLSLNIGPAGRQRRERGDTEHSYREIPLNHEATVCSLPHLLARDQ